MNKTLVGLLFIFAGLGYGTMSIDAVYNLTLGRLVENGWVKSKPQPKDSLNTVVGRKPAILFYSVILIIIGLFILWNRNA